MPTKVHAEEDDAIRLGGLGRKARVDEAVRFAKARQGEEDGFPGGLPQAPNAKPYDVDREIANIMTLNEIDTLSSTIYQHDKTDYEDVLTLAPLPIVETTTQFSMPPVGFAIINTGTNVPLNRELRELRRMDRAPANRPVERLHTCDDARALRRIEEEAKRETGAYLSKSTSPKI